MRECREKKRVQIYLDGWLERNEAARFEDHLRSCVECQTALIEQEEISAAALEIVDHAPEREYWNGFFKRVQKRVYSRDVSPYAGKRNKSFRLRFAYYSAAIISSAAIFLLALAYLSRAPLHDNRSEVLRQSEGLNSAAGTEETPMPIESAVEDRNIQPPLRTGNAQSNLEAVEYPVRQPGRQQTEGARSETAGVSNKAGDSLAPDLDDYKTAFRDPSRIAPAKLSLSEDENLVTRLLLEYGGLSMDDFSVSPNVVAEGILAGFRTGTDGATGGAPLNGRAPSASDANYPRWGYLGVPFDSSRADGYQRYLIEIELMRVK